MNWIKNKLNNTYAKLMVFAALVMSPSLAQALPADDAQAVITTATDVFALAAAVGISVLAYRIVKGLVSRFSK